jgi:hypothetical protein
MTPYEPMINPFGWFLIGWLCACILIWALHRVFGD